MRMLLSDLQAVAGERPPGYVAAVVSAGTAEGDWLEIAEEKLLEVQHAFGVEPTAGPTIWEIALNFTASMARWAADGFPTVTAGEYQSRALTCAACVHYKPLRAWHGCALCGCSHLKLHLKTERCPAGKWQ